MLALIAKFDIAEGREADFESAMGALAEQVRANEPGNELYTLCKDADGNYLMLELYKDEAALAAHGQTEHMKAAGPSFQGVMAGRPELQQLEVVC